RHHVRRHRAAECRKSHLDVDALRSDRDVVDQPKVDDVHRNLRVEALAEDLDHVLKRDRRIWRHRARRGEFRHGISSGKPASFQALVPPRKLTTSLTPSATAISEATD